MLFLCFTNHVFDIYLQIPSFLMGKNYVHELLVCDANVLEAEGRDIVVVIVMVRHRGDFGCI